MNTKNILECIDSIDRECISAEISICESLAERYCKMILIMENYYDDNVDNFSIFQEGKILDEATGKGKDENVVTKIAMFIPRLINAIIQIIKRGLSKSKKVDKINEKEFNLSAIKNNGAVGKIIKSAGCVILTASATGIAIGIRDYSPAVEFKDDVKFVISESGRLKIIFPYYKIDQVNNFNKEIDPKISALKQYLESKSKPDKGDSVFSNLSKSFKNIVTNQTRISEREFSFDEYEEFIADTIKSFETFSDKLSKIQKLFNTPEGQKANKEIIDNQKSTLIHDLNAIVKKTPGDIELITKLDEKIRKVFSIITNPNDSRRNKKKYAKFKYEPLSKSEIVDIYKFDTSFLTSAIRKMNEFYKKEIADNDKNILKLSYDAEQSDLFKSAIEDLEKQFDVKLVIQHNMDNGNATFTSVYKKSNKYDMSLSKSKGLRLGGGTIYIELDVRSIVLKFMESTSINAPFGQHVCSTICHEIFHNVIDECYVYCNKTLSVINDIVYNILHSPTILQKRLEKIINSVNNKLKNIFGKNPDVESDELLKKRLVYVRLHMDDPKAIEQFEKAVQNGTDEKYLRNDDFDELSKSIDTHESNSSAKLTNSVSDILHHGPVIECAIFSIMVAHVGSIISGASSIVGLSLLVSRHINNRMETMEQMCDSFAAMYKLPVTFGDQRSLINNGSKRKSKQSNTRHDVHGSKFDRTNVGYNIAKRMLESGEKLDPEIEDYLRFVVNKNEGINLAERHLTKKEIRKLTPEFTENIGNAISTFAKKHNIPITECFIDIGGGNEFK